MKKWFLSFSIACCALFFYSSIVTADDFSVSAKHAIAVEVSTGKILYDQDAQTKAGIASITKLLTIYLVYEALEKGEITLDTQVDISDYPYALSVESAVSNVAFNSRKYSVSDLLNASLITSANSAAIALAEKIAGSEPAFVDRMKQKLTEWGITGTSLFNVTGLNNEFLGNNIYPGSATTDENRMSAQDVAFIARRLILDYPQVLKITSQYSYQFDGTTYYSTNQMLADGTHARGGVDGLKTGTTDLAGASFVATTTQNNMRIITVVLNANDGGQYPDNRFVATNQLMDYVYNNFSFVTIAQKGKTYQSSSLSVFNGQSAKVNAVAENDLIAVVQNGKDSPVTATFKATSTELDAPVKQSSLLGTLTLSDSNLIGKGYLESQPSVKMIAEKEIPAAIWPISWWNYFVRFVNDKL